VRQVRTRSGKRVVSYVTKRVPVRVYVTPRASRNASCSTQFVNAARGTIDADDAIAKTAAEGFARGTVIFLDIERMDAVPKAMRDYYRAWTARVAADGRFQPAYYAHSFNANLVYSDVKQVLTAAGERRTIHDQYGKEVRHEVSRQQRQARALRTRVAQRGAVRRVRRRRFLIRAAR